MESHREEQKKAWEPNAGQKLKRFRIVKLEERIAPGNGNFSGKCIPGTNLCTLGDECNPTGVLVGCVGTRPPGHCK